MSNPHALRIPDILYHVFQCFESRRELARSAQVCRLWSVIALDILWRDLPALFPLLELYGLQFSRAEGFPVWGFGTTGPHVPEERYRQMYLPRIQSLRHDFSNGDVIMMSTLQELTSIDIHMPNLRTLNFQIPCNVDADFPGAIPLIVPTIKSLRLPGIPIITGVDMPMFRQLLDSICNTPGLSLEHLDVGGIALLHPAMIKALCSLVRQQSSLRHLGVALSNTELFSSACNRDEEDPAVTSLKLHHPSIPQIANLDFIRPLSRFRHLTALDLDATFTLVGIAERDVKAMASNWPALRHLRLGNIWGAAELLVSIARVFPSLETLGVSLRYADAGWPRLTDTTPRFSQLKELHLRLDPGRARFTPELETSGGRALARLIVAICPNETELLLQSGWGVEGIRQFCTSLEMVEGAVLEALRRRSTYQRDSTSERTGGARPILRR